MHVCVLLFRLDLVTEDVAKLRLQVKELYPLQLWVWVWVCGCGCNWGISLNILDSQPVKMKMSGCKQKLSEHRQKL